MKKFLMMLAVLVFVSGCAARHSLVKASNTVQIPAATDGSKPCVETDYRNDGGVFIKVNCPGRLIHVVVKLKPNINYAVLIGSDPILVVKSSLDGIIVFVNEKGKDVEIIPEMNDEDMKKIKTSPPLREATADKGGE